MKPYKLPQNYLPFGEFKKHIDLITKIKPKPIEVVGVPSIGNNLSYMYGMWAQGYPLYCVRESLLDDMLQTDVGENLPLFADINLEMPSYTLFFPQNKIKSLTGKGYINYLIVNHQELTIPDYSHMISWGGCDSKNALFFASKRIRRDGTLQISAFTGDTEEQKQQALEIRNIVLQSILLLQYYPEIQQDIEVMPGKERGFSSSAKTPSDFRLPRWLGQERKSRSKNPDSPGTGSTKSPHYRRSHWRVQPCGEGRSNTKVIKVRPAWVHNS